jgi:hypothetical protein
MASQYDREDKGSFVNVGFKIPKTTIWQPCHNIRDGKVNSGFSPCSFILINCIFDRRKINYSFSFVSSFKFWWLLHFSIMSFLKLCFLTDSRSPSQFSFLFVQYCLCQNYYDVQSPPTSCPWSLLLRRQKIVLCLCKVWPWFKLAVNLQEIPITPFFVCCDAAML